MTYRPAAATADLVRAAYPTCTFPGCTVAAHRCELDHQVEYDHQNPLNGGWTIAGNLHPLCKRHHQMKTRKLWHCTALGGGAVYWRSATGVARITVPIGGRVAGAPADPSPPPDPEPRESVVDLLTPDEELDLLYQPTWWELHMADAPPPPPHDTDLRTRYREHRAVTERRGRLMPPPF